jgi:WD40 repeat protein
LLGIVIISLVVAIAGVLLTSQPANRMTEPIMTIPGSATALTWGKDELTLATGQLDGTVEIWGFSNDPAQIRATHRRPDVWVTAIAVSPDGKLAVIGYYDGSVEIWDIESGVSRLLLQPNPYYVHLVSWSPSGNKILSSSVGTTRIWEVGTDNQPIVLQEDMVHLMWTPDSSLIVGTSGGYTRVWDANTGAIVTNRIEVYVSPVELSPDGTVLAGATGIWNILTGNLVTRACNDCISPARTPDIAWSLDGAWIASSSADFLCQNGNPYCVEDSTIRIWDAATGQLGYILEGHEDSVIDVMWQSDNILISVSFDDTVRVWNVATQENVATVYAGRIFSTGQAILSPKGTMVAVVGDDDAVRVWNLLTPPSETQ